MAYEYVLYNVLNQVATITLNRPEAMNAMNKGLRDDLCEAICAAASSEEVRTIVIAGSGKSFSSGPDLAEVTNAPCLYDLIEDDYKRIYNNILTCPKPIIAAVRGASAGVGASITLACDLVIMGESAFLFLAFANMGLIPDGGICWQLARNLGQKRAYQLIAESARISASECLTWGLANKIVTDDKLQEEVQSWAERLAQAAPLTLKYSKQVLQQAMRIDYMDTMRLESGIQQMCYKTEDSKEAIKAFFEKRKPVFTGN